MQQKRKSKYKYIYIGKYSFTVNKLGQIPFRYILIKEKSNK